MTDQQNLTPRERFLQEQQQIEDANLKAKGKDPDEEKELNELTDDMDKKLEAEEQQLDKNMGDVKVPNSVSMTNEQFQANKAQQEAQAALANLRQHNLQHLTPAQEKKLKDLEIKFQNGEITDPILMHLLKKRRQGLDRKKQLAEQGRELNIKLLNELSRVTTEAMENAGMLKDVDKDLLEHIENES